MRFEVHHSIRYSYDRPVFLEPHVFLLRPRDGEVQRVLEHELVLEPKPSLQTASIDLSGNPAVFAWFRGEHRELRIEARSGIELVCANPFDYLPDDCSRRVPVFYPEPVRPLLGPFVKAGAAVPEPVKAFSHDIAARTHHSTVPFLVDLNRTLSIEFERERRVQGAPRPPDETLKLRRGTCRDLSVLFMACCRAQGFAARFVSGYHDTGSGADERDLHAWVEVYVSGGGWRGFDPTSGLAVTESHIALAASALPELTMPVTGSFRGPSGTARMTYEVRVRRSLQPA